MVRIDIEGVWYKFSFGGGANYYSHMENIDDLFLFIYPDLSDFMDRHQKGDLIVLARIGYQFNQNNTLNIVLNNVTNQEYALRPARAAAPRNIAIPYRMKLI